MDGKSLSADKKKNIIQLLNLCIVKNLLETKNLPIGMINAVQMDKVFKSKFSLLFIMFYKGLV